MNFFFALRISGEAALPVFIERSTGSTTVAMRRSIGEIISFSSRAATDRWQPGRVRGAERCSRRAYGEAEVKVAVQRLNRRDSFIFP